MFSRWSRAEVEGSECRSYQRLRETIRQTLAFTASERGSHITSPHTHPPPHLSACVSLVPCVCHENSIKPISVSLCLLAVFSVWSVKPWVLVIWVIRPPAVRIKVCSDAFDTHRSVWYWYSSADADGCVTDAAQSHVFYCKTHNNNNTIFLQRTHTQHEARKHRWRGSDSATWQTETHEGDSPSAHLLETVIITDPSERTCAITVRKPHRWAETEQKSVREQSKNTSAVSTYKYTYSH